MKPRILFVQQFSVPYFGILSMLGRLKERGLDAEVVVASLENDAVAAVVRLQPDVVGFSVMSVEHQWLSRIVSAVKASLPDTVLLVGGMHAVLYPEEVLTIAGVDLVCTGDGEEVMLAVLRELGGISDWSTIEGVGYRDMQGKVRINPRAALVPYGSEIVEDRSVYFRRYPLLARDTAQRFISSRGCPYRCSFCYNDTLRTIFHDKGTYVRRKTVSSLIEEIRLVCGQNQVESVFFMDDLFTMDKEWLREFLASYRKEVAIPFVCTSRANIMDEERAALLAGSGCRTVSFGVESGTYRIRKEILQKDISDEQIIACGRMLKRHGIKVQTTNMFCLPGETLEDALRTVELNIRAGTDYAFASLLMPFPKTAIAEYCIEHGFVKPDFSLQDVPESFMTRSILRLEDKERIINIQRLSYFFIGFPRFYRGFAWLVRMTALRPVFDRIFELSNFLRHKGERGIGLISALRYAWRMRKYF